MVKRDGCLYACEEFADLFLELKDGDYFVNIKKNRNAGFHRKYFALLNKVFENQDIYSNIDDLRFEIILKTGHYKTHFTMKGNKIYIPNSISFDNMDEIEFEDLYNKTIDVVFQFFIKGTPEDEKKFIQELSRF